jgi:hypothetical protein
LLHAANRCKYCHRQSIETIFLALSPNSEWSGLSAAQALSLIFTAIFGNYNVPMMAAQLQVDHSTDPVTAEDGLDQYDRKIKIVSKIQERLTRMQEVVHGLGRYLDHDSHVVKGVVSRDHSGDHKSVATSRDDRKAASLAQRALADTTKIMQRTDFIFDDALIQSILEWNLMKFLHQVLPHWEDRFSTEIRERALASVDLVSFPIQVCSFQGQPCRKCACTVTHDSPKFTGPGQGRYVPVQHIRYCTMFI